MSGMSSISRLPFGRLAILSAILTLSSVSLAAPRMMLEGQALDARSEAVAQPQRAPYPDHEVAASIRERAATQGLPVTVARGSKARRPLLVFETETEANVFRALLTAATALEEGQDG